MPFDTYWLNVVFSLSRLQFNYAQRMGGSRAQRRAGNSPLHQGARPLAMEQTVQH